MRQQNVERTMYSSILKNVKKLDTYGKTAVYKYIVDHNIKFSKNSNGLFVDLDCIDKYILVDLNNFITQLNTNSLVAKTKNDTRDTLVTIYSDIISKNSIKYRQEKELEYIHKLTIHSDNIKLVVTDPVTIRRAATTATSILTKDHRIPRKHNNAVLRQNAFLDSYCPDDSLLDDTCSSSYTNASFVDDNNNDDLDSSEIHINQYQDEDSDSDLYFKKCKTFLMSLGYVFSCDEIVYQEYIGALDV